jgi:hypothetical protein
MSLAVTLEYSLSSEARIPGPLHLNLGGARVNAKGTTRDYLTHLNGIPGQKMTQKPGFLRGG